MSKAEAVVYATLDDLARRRRIVTQLIRDIAMVYGVDVRPWLEDATPTNGAPVETKKPKREPKAGQRKTRPMKGLADDRSVLEALKKANGLMTPMALRDATGLSPYLLQRAIERLGSQVTTTGESNARRIALVP